MTNESPLSCAGAVINMQQEASSYGHFLDSLSCFIWPCSAFDQYDLFQNQFSTECELVLPLSISNILVSLINICTILHHRKFLFASFYKMIIIRKHKKYCINTMNFYTHNLHALYRVYVCCNKMQTLPAGK